jgi:hypothetical protein
MPYAIARRYPALLSCPLIEKIPLISSIFEHIGQFPNRFPAWMGYFGGPSQPIFANGR